jgi:three-Cys-motif partner protein
LILAFVDPTKIEPHYSTLKSLTEDYRMDLLMTIFDGLDIKRNFNLYKDKGNASSLGQFLGGNVPWKELKEAKDAVELFKKRVQDLSYKTVQFKDIPIYNTKNAEMYFLFFASRHKQGLDFWQKITARDHRGQYEFL